MGIQKICQWSSSSDKVSCSFNGEVKQMRENPVLGADSGNDSDDCELAELNCEFGMVEGQRCSIPYELYDLPDLREILSLDTWNLCLTEEERFNLSAYLPDMEHETFCLTMKELFDGTELYFGNPLDKFLKRLKAGLYPPKVACFREGLQFLQRKQHYHSLRAYHDRMIQTFLNMRMLWDQYGMSPGIEEKISMWKNRRKQKSINMLDLNESPKDDHLLNEDNLEMKVMKLVESEGSAKDRSPFPCTNRTKIVAPYCRPKGVLKMKASGNDSFRNHNSKMVVADSSGHCRSLPKGVLKIVPKVPSFHLEQSDIVPRGVQSNFPARTHGIRDFKFSPLPASVCFQNAGSLHEYPFLRKKADGDRAHSTLDQPQFLIDPQEIVRVTRNLPVSSTRSVKQESLPTLDDNSVVVKHKLFGVDMGRFPNKECRSSLDTVDSRPYTFGGENLGENVDSESNGSFLKSVESFPFRIQYHGGEQCVAPLKEEHLTIYPRISEVVPAISDIGNDNKQETLMDSSSHQKNGEHDVSVRKSEKLSSKSSVSVAFKDKKLLPLTYKRRKVLAKANSLNFSKSLTADTNLKSVITKEPDQDFMEGVKTVKIKLMGLKDMP
uniref:DEUBAD domain-containing protein n=1 Tax=Salix viminalis TaxID=40686 RepID=A0A6N2L864_SALVM